MRVVSEKVGADGVGGAGPEYLGMDREKDTHLFWIAGAAVYLVPLRVLLAQLGTDLAYGGPRHAVLPTREPGTDVACGGTGDAICRCECYAQPGTDLAYDATRNGSYGPSPRGVDRAP
eukprot:3170335-Rhodomonas_salina.1